MTNKNIVTDFIWILNLDYRNGLVKSGSDPKLYKTAPNPLILYNWHIDYKELLLNFLGQILRRKKTISVTSVAHFFSSLTLLLKSLKCTLPGPVFPVLSIN